MMLCSLLTYRQTENGRCKFEMQEPPQDSPPQTPSSVANYANGDMGIMQSTATPQNSTPESSNAAPWENMFTTPLSSAPNGHDSAKTLSNASAVLNLPELYRHVEQEERDWHRELALAKLERAPLPRNPTNNLSPIPVAASPTKLAFAPTVTVINPAPPCQAAEKTSGGKGLFEGLKNRLRGKHSKAQLKTVPAATPDEPVPEFPSSAMSDLEKILVSPEYPDELKCAATSINESLRNARKSQDSDGVVKLERMSDSLVQILRYSLALKEQKDVANAAADRAQAKYDDCIQVVMQLTRMFHSEDHSLPALIRKHTSG